MCCQVRKHAVVAVIEILCIDLPGNLLKLENRPYVALSEVVYSLSQVCGGMSTKKIVLSLCTFSPSCTIKRLHLLGRYRACKKAS